MKKPFKILESIGLPILDWESHLEHSACHNKDRPGHIHFLHNNPSIVILIGLFSRIIPIAMFPTYTFYYVILISLALNIVIAICTNWQIGIKTTVWCIVGLAISFFYNSQFSNNYSNLLPSENCGAQIKAIVTDPELTDNKVSWLPAPKYIKMVVRAIKCSDKDKWLKSSGLTNVVLPRNCTPPPYGEILELEGNFISPQNAPFPGSFDYAKYLRSQKINKLFVCSSYKTNGYAGFPFNLYREIYSFRNFALNALCSDIEVKETKAFLAGFFFGCRQGLTSQMKQIFLRSGTIHILAISGLHVGILALILLFIFRALPITPRYLIVPLVLFCYVFLTGFRPSGLRALLMISVFCFHKAFFYSIRPLNSIAFAAVIILLLNPFAVNNTGFQFSFIIAGFLVLSWEKTNNCVRIIEEKNNWVVSANFTFLKRIGYAFRKKVLLLTITSAIAGIAGTGLILYYQSLFIPSMILLNILILPLLLPLFLIGFIKILTFFILGKSLFLLNFLLDGIISIIIHIANWGAYSAFTKYYQQPPLIVLIIFYVLLTSLCIIHKKKNILIFISLIWGLFILCLYGNIFGIGKITIIQGTGNTPPAIIVKSNSYSYPNLINCPDKLGRIIVDKLKKEGVNSLESVVITKISKKYSGGLLYLLSQIPIKQLILPKKIRKTKLYKKLISLCFKNNIDISYLPCTLKSQVSLSIKNNKRSTNSSMGTNQTKPIKTAKDIIWDENKIKSQFTWNFINTKISIEILRLHPGFKKLLIKVNEGKTSTFEIKNSNFLQIFECSIPLNG
jgi:ComEC/Rec2-related protein